VAAVRFSALTVVGDGEGKVGFGRGKAREVPVAIQKAMENARKNMKTIALKDGTLQYPMTSRHGAAKVHMQPASEGTGIIAGGAMRAVFEVVGCAERAGQVHRLQQPRQRGARHDEGPGRMSCIARGQVAAKRGKSVEEITGINHG
jgi:small subunit ribosomal protein S5